MLSQKFSLPTSTTNPAFSIILRGCSVTWDKIKVIFFLLHERYTSSNFRNADTSIAGTSLILNMTTFVFLSADTLKNLSAAAKNIGPSSSYTSVPLGTMRSPSLSSSTYSQLLTSATSDILFKNKITASINPISIATTKSNTTVSTNVVTSTNISLFGAVFKRVTNSLQPHIL